MLISSIGSGWPPYGLKHIFVGYGKATLINKKSPESPGNESSSNSTSRRPECTTRLINHQADGLGPVSGQHSAGDDYLHDPAYPDETDKRSLAKSPSPPLAEPEQVSPFMMNWSRSCNVLVDAQLDLVKSGSLSAEQAMREATRRRESTIDRRKPAAKPPLYARGIRSTHRGMARDDGERSHSPLLRERVG